MKYKRYKTYIAQTNPRFDKNMNMINYHSQSFKHVIMGHYCMPLKHSCDVIKQY